MKKILFFLLILVAYILATRFVSIETTSISEQPPPIKCLSEGEARTHHAKLTYSCRTLEAINEEYLKEIKPIFQRKCLMCHGQVQRLPLYTQVWPSSLLVSRNATEAKEEIDMRFNYPFNAGKDPEEVFEHLTHVVEDGSMPPFIYKVMHWKSGLTTTEAEKILAWIKFGQSELQKEIPSIKKPKHEHKHDHSGHHNH